MGALQLHYTSDSPSYLDLDHLSTTTTAIPSQPYSCLVQTLIDPEFEPLIPPTAPELLAKRATSDTTHSHSPSTALSIASHRIVSHHIVGHTRTLLSSGGTTASGGKETEQNEHTCRRRPIRKLYDPRASNV